MASIHQNAMPCARHSGDHLLPLAQEVRRHDCLRCPAVRAMEKKNARLKCQLAERDLEVDALRALLAKKSWPWQCGVRQSSSCLPVGSRSVGPVSCCRGAARPSATRRDRIAMRSWQRRSTNSPAGIPATASGECERCSGVAASALTRSTCIGSGSMRNCRSARSRASAG